MLNFHKYVYFHYNILQNGFKLEPKWSSIKSRTFWNDDTLWNILFPLSVQAIATASTLPQTENLICEVKPLPWIHPSSEHLPAFPLLSLVPFL